MLGLNPTQLTRLGVLRMFQMTRVFNRVSAFDNLIVCGLAMGLDEPAASRRALELLEELRLTHVMHLDGGQLSGGQKKLLEFGYLLHGAAAHRAARRAIRSGAPGDERDDGGVHQTRETRAARPSSW